MHDIDKQGSFYLGRPYDLAQAATSAEPLLYKSKDLTTHAVCVGMTGSGKTGLGIALLEEAALDGLPAIVIDPKGDMGNLLLTFPELRPEDFRPWIDTAEAARQGQTLDQLAQRTADRWRSGLAEWDQSGERIARLREAVEMTIYTPGSRAGVPLSLLGCWSAPASADRQDGETLRERVDSAVSGLLALLDVAGDPLQSREHILLANLFAHCWLAGQDVEPATLMRLVQTPPFDRVGFLDLESFFPAKDRFALATRINNLFASPGFAGYLDGEPLNVERLLYSESGRPRVSIISIAHLADSQRMALVTTLLGEVIAWMRRQSGTSSLRALLYMDEVFGYFPPTANPPSKTPMLTLLKQARAFGLGVVLATQNPVDLDYKGLSNAGTWLIGRLQTDRDKQRVLDGLEGASTTAGASFNRRTMETMLSALGNRVFLLHSVHEDAPRVFQTRWALSYLCGPLTREQIGTLMQSRTGNHPSAASAAVGNGSVSSGTVFSGAAVGATSAEAALASGAELSPDVGLSPGIGLSPGAKLSPGAGLSSGAALSLDSTRPVLPPSISELFQMRRGALPSGQRLVYRPALLASGKLHYVDAKSRVDHWQDLWLRAPAESSPQVWEEAEPLAAPVETDPEPEQGAQFDTLPGELMRATTYAALATALKGHLYRVEQLSLWNCSVLKEASQPGESEQEFRQRLAPALRTHLDAEVEKVRSRFESRLSTVSGQLLRAGQRVDKQKSQVSHQWMQTILSFLSMLLGALTGRKWLSSTNVRSASSSMRAAGRAAQQQQNTAQAEESLEAIQQKQQDLEQQRDRAIADLQESLAPDIVALERLDLQPRKSDITIERLSLLWVPHRAAADGRLESLA